MSARQSILPLLLVVGLLVVLNRQVDPTSKPLPQPVVTPIWGSKDPTPTPHPTLIPQRVEKIYRVDGKGPFVERTSKIGCDVYDALSRLDLTQGQLEEANSVGQEQKVFIELLPETQLPREAVDDLQQLQFGVDYNEEAHTIVLTYPTPCTSPRG